MFNQHLKNLVQYNKRINLATLAQDIKTCGFHARYAECYVAKAK
jgi:hypothetical protein